RRPRLPPPKSLPPARHPRPPRPHRQTRRPNLPTLKPTRARRPAPFPGANPSPRGPISQRNDPAIKNRPHHIDARPPRHLPPPRQRQTQRPNIPTINPTKPRRPAPFPSANPSPRRPTSQSNDPAIKNRPHHIDARPPRHLPPPRPPPNKRPQQRPPRP